MNTGNFFAELKRRNVYKVAVAYAVVGWLIIQISSTVLPTFHAPEWVVQTLVVLVALGFPIALVLAWAFELTPEGIKRAEDVAPGESITRKTGRNLIGITVALAVVAAGLLAFQFLRPKPEAVAPALAPPPATQLASTASEKSIAVLPFENLSEDKANAYFAEGVQDEILTRLAKVGDLKVISRTSTQRFKSSPDDLPQIAKQLGVLHILEGSVQKSGDSVRVNVQLINALTDAHLWAEIYDRKLTDIFAVESDIAKTIADTLQATLTGSEKKLIASQSTADTTAYELYHRGRSCFGRRGADNLRNAIEFYQQAVERDPNYALAYAGMSEAYSILPRYAAVALKDANPKAKAAALKALQLDPQLGEAHNAMASVLFAGDMDVNGSIAEFQRAIALNPNYATAHHWLACDALLATGRFDEGIAEGRRATELDPLSAVVRADLGMIFLHARRFDDAITELKKAIELDPAFYYGYWSLGLALQLKGNPAAALIEYEKARARDDNGFMPVLIATAQARMGDREAIPRQLRTLDELSAKGPVPASWRGMLYAQLGDAEQAVHWLEQAYANRDARALAPIASDPLIDPIRGNPKFEAFVKKVRSGPFPP
ncbi:MAG: tetratricopeptide repeat protein [Verrucomicrobiota bacterium]|nr:tetratricopeptide repeat protein [Verrucomicrobiota bacterium]